jgi:glycosyltransferase involved in cell wall biosynthesis
MRIGIGAILGTLGGPATYARELIGALARIDTRTEYVVITDAPRALAVEAPNVRCVALPLAKPMLQPVWDHAVVPALVRRYGLDLYHGTKGTLPLWRGCKQVVTIHDLAVYHQPQTFAWVQRVQQRSQTPLAARRAARVIAVSASARRDILARFRLPEAHVVAIPLGVAPRFSGVAGPEDDRIAAAAGLPLRFVLYAGTIQPRKNVEMLVDAFAATRRREAELLIAGRVRPGYRPRFLTQPPPGVRYLGPVSDQVLVVLYRRALALFSPSTYEGFGLSLLEAMASGCLVVAGHNSAIPELVGDHGILLPELTVASLRGALARVLGGDASLDVLRAGALERAGRYRWEETARRTLAVYQDVCAPPPRPSSVRGEAHGGGGQSV